MTDNFSYLSSFIKQIRQRPLWVDIGDTALNKVDNILVPMKFEFRGC